jgi:transcriptional regulator with XRE-family HTH domain/Zn-dependent peptidase ImmA (M78 family)
MEGKKMSWQGHYIKTLAKEKKLTLQSVADQVGVSRQALNSWAKGQVPKGGHLLRLCKSFGVSPETFFVSEIDSRIAVPMHRARKTAKLNDSMQGEARVLASSYELFFREASDPGLVQSLRIYKKTEDEVRKASLALRKLGGVENDAPMAFHHVFSLVEDLGVNIIFSNFHKNIKAYAFYTKINNHRVVFVNFETKIIDLIFAILHESIHSIRDESQAYDASYTYDKDEEDFCDLVASYAQLTDGYFSFVTDSIKELAKSAQLSQLAKFAKKYNHSMHAIKVRIEKFIPEFKHNVYPIETRVRKDSPTVRSHFFDAKDAREYIECWRNVSPVFISHVIEQSDKLSPRRICELISIDSCQWSP